MNFLSPTQSVGLLSCVVSMGWCFVAWTRREMQRENERSIVLLVVLIGALLLDLVFNVRFHLHDWLADQFKVYGMYDGRRPRQALALLVVGMSACFGLWLVVRRLRGRVGAQLTACGVFMWVSCWVVEVISLHQVDSLLYHTVFASKRSGRCG